MTDSWRSLYPFESHFVERDGVRQHYLDEGQGASLVMVHGNHTWSFYWRNLVLGLRGSCRAIVPELLSLAALALLVSCGESESTPLSSPG